MNRGQIISLDSVIALIIVMLSLGIVFNVMEIHSYNLKEEQLFEEISSVGKTASALLVSNPDFICKVNAGEKELFSMNNCIDSSKNITKEYLGIDGQKYNCELTTNAAIQLKTTCNDSPEQAENIYSETREVVFNKGPISKADFDKKHFPSAIITLKVWKK